jgi:hypothetical protein
MDDAASTTSQNGDEESSTAMDPNWNTRF